MSAPAVAVDAPPAPPPAADPAPADPLADAATRNAAVKQVEFYFSDSNAPRDAFLLSKIQADPEVSGEEKGGGREGGEGRGPTRKIGGRRMRFSLTLNLPTHPTNRATSTSRSSAPFPGWPPPWAWPAPNPPAAGARRCRRRRRPRR